MECWITKDVSSVLYTFALWLKAAFLTLVLSSIQNKRSDTTNSQQETSVDEAKALKEVIGRQQKHIQDLEESIGAYTLRLHALNQVLTDQSEEIRQTKLKADQLQDIHLEKRRELQRVHRRTARRRLKLKSFEHSLFLGS